MPWIPRCSAACDYKAPLHCETSHDRRQRCNAKTKIAGQLKHKEPCTHSSFANARKSAGIIGGKCFSQYMGGAASCEPCSSASTVEESFFSSHLSLALWKLFRCPAGPSKSWARHFARAARQLHMYISKILRTYTQHHWGSEQGIPGRVAQGTACRPYANKDAMLECAMLAVLVSSSYRL